MKKLLLTIMILAIILSLSTTSIYVVNHESDLSYFNVMLILSVICTALFVGGGLLLWSFYKKIEDKNVGYVGCLCMIIVLVLTIIAFIIGVYTGSYVFLVLLYPVLYTVIYVFSIAWKLLIALLVASFIPSVLFSLIDKNLKKNLFCFLAVMAISIGVTADVFLFSLLPKNLITTETFFPEWTLGERMDIILDAGEDIDDEEDDDSYETSDDEDDEEWE